jgi:hypothetical protein
MRALDATDKAPDDSSKSSGANDLQGHPTAARAVTSFTR